MPDELRSQIEPLHAIIKAMGLAVIVESGVEADDVIGTLAKHATEKGIDTLISTGDKDMAQLVNEHVTLINTMTNQLMDVEGVNTKFGIPPELVIDFLALKGDKVDNIPGVPGVGDKSAQALLNGIGGIDDIYKNLDKIADLSFRGSKSMAAKMQEYEEQARLSYTLATISIDLDLDYDVEALMPCQADNEQLRDLFAEYEFKRWHAEVSALIAGGDTSGANANTNEEKSDSAEESEQSESVEIDKSKYETVLDEERFNAWVAKLEKAELIAFDTETTSLNYMDAELVGVSFCIEEGEAAYVPVAHDYPDAPAQLSREFVLDALKPILESDTVIKVGQHIKYDKNVLANYDITLNGIGFDTMLESYVLNSTAQRHDMDSLALAYLGHKTIHFEEIAGKGAKQLTFNQISLEEAGPYAAADADMTGRLRLAFEGSVIREDMDSLMSDMEMPLVPVLVTMQRHGIKLDTAVLREMSEDMREQMFQTEEELYKSIGHTVNINSPQQLSDLLFNEIGLPKTKRTKTGYSTDANSLEGLKGLHPVVDQILDYRQVSKLKSTYVDALPDMVNPATGRVHTSYNQAGSATGRMSSSDPNLQNIPIRTELGRQVRKAFVADGAPDWLLFSADYSQIELRVLAHLSQDPGLIKAFKRGEDIHASTASLMFEVPLNQVDADQRRIAKVLNFGVIYGLSPHGISQQTGFSREEGASFIENYFSKYPGINAVSYTHLTLPTNREV